MSLFETVISEGRGENKLRSTRHREHESLLRPSSPFTTRGGGVDEENEILSSEKMAYGSNARVSLPPPVTSNDVTL